MAEQSGTGEGGLASVNGDTGPAVVLDASDIPSTGPSTVQADLDALSTDLGTAKIITSQADLEAAFPNVAGVHTINLPTLWTAPAPAGLITLDSGRSIIIVHPGSIDALGVDKVSISGDVASPLISGEIVMANVIVGNTNAAGSDMSASSLFGRPIVIDKVVFSGHNPGLLDDVMGAGLITGCVLQPPAIVSSVGLTFSGSMGNIRISELFSQSPGVVAYTAMSFDATVDVTNLLDISGCQLNGVSGDFLVDIDSSATLPTGALPTVIVGVRISGCMISGLADVFDPTGLGDADIEVLALANVGGRTSSYLSDVLVVTGANPTISLAHTGAGVDDIIPYDNSGNGGAGGTLSTLTAQAVQERWSLDITDPNPVIWHVRLDGPARVLNGNVVFEIEMSKSGGASPAVTAVVMRSQSLGPFSPIENSRSELVTLVTAPRRIVSGARVKVGNGDRFAIAIRTDSPGTDTEITLVEFDIPGTA